MDAEQAVIPQHQWTHDGDRVLLVKCVDPDGKGHKGFQYPKSGQVKPDYCSTAPDCKSGGLFGWPWGINLGGGKEPDYRGIWLVLSAPPAQVVLCGDKAKVAAATPDDVDCEVVYYGDALGALIRTMKGRVAWIQHSARGSASATGVSGSASATGVSGSASATGGSGSASATGESGSASATGERGIAALSGEYGSLVVTHQSLGAVTANEWTWVVRPGAVVACRWKDGDHWQHALLVADNLGLADGAVVAVKNGAITRKCGRDGGGLSR